MTTDTKRLSDCRQNGAIKAWMSTAVKWCWVTSSSVLIYWNRSIRCWRSDPSTTSVMICRRSSRKSVGTSDTSSCVATKIAPGNTVERSGVGYLVRQLRPRMLCNTTSMRRLRG